jgi:hypothetical protein
MSRKTARRDGLKTDRPPKQPVTILEAVMDGDMERWRKLAGLTIAEVVALLDVTPSTWHRWMTGQSRPEPKYRVRLEEWRVRQADALSVMRFVPAG